MLQHLRFLICLQVYWLIRIIILDRFWISSILHERTRNYNGNKDFPANIRLKIIKICIDNTSKSLFKSKKLGNPFKEKPFNNFKIHP